MKNQAPAPGNLIALLALKRHERPPENFFMEFIAEFHARQSRIHPPPPGRLTTPLSPCGKPPANR
jgi:hypothetical protein